MCLFRLGAVLWRYRADFRELSNGPVKLEGNGAAAAAKLFCLSEKQHPRFETTGASCRLHLSRFSFKLKKGSLLLLFLVRDSIITKEIPTRLNPQIPTSANPWIS